MLLQQRRPLQLKQKRFAYCNDSEHPATYSLSNHSLNCLLTSCFTIKLLFIFEKAIFNKIDCHQHTELYSYTATEHRTDAIPQIMSLKFEFSLSRDRTNMLPHSPIDFDVTPNRSCHSVSIPKSETLLEISTIDKNGK